MKIVLLLVASAVLFGEKLVNVETGSIVVEFMEGKIAFSDRFLEIEMKETGIYIPPTKTDDFNQKEIVYLGDPLFQKAFLDVYYPLSIANSLHQWQD